MMVIDEHGEGIPVAFILSNREDRTTLRAAFAKIHARVGDIKATHGMTDDADQFFSAWCDVFGEGPQKLLCAWHVIRSWQQTIRSKIKDEHHQKEVSVK